MVSWAVTLIFHICVVLISTNVVELEIAGLEVGHSGRVFCEDESKLE
jgi:hypothetical protein